MSKGGVLIDLSNSTDIFKINVTHYNCGSSEGVRNEKQFIRNEFDETSITSYDKDFHSGIKFDVDDKEAIIIDDLVVMNIYCQQDKSMIYNVDVKHSIINKVMKHCHDVGLECVYTTLCDTLIFYVKDYAMGFNYFDDKILKNIPDTLAYSTNLKNTVERSLKTCFSSVVWL